VQELCRVGGPALGTTEYSLFVYESNDVAVRLYRSLGFVEIPYPEPTGGLEGMLYMVTTDPK
jgi:ribosomal protein S18 acetylase RimI-like enzyme